MEFNLCRGGTFPTYCPGLLNRRDVLQLLNIHGYGRREDVYLHGRAKMKTEVFVCVLPPYLWIFSN